MHRFINWMLICLALFSLAGCQHDDPVVPEARQPLQAATKTELMDLFRTAYSGMDLEGYTDLLHTDYQFIYLDQDDVTVVTWYITEELRCSANMFSGEIMTNSEGRLVGGISSIDINRLDIKYWEDITAEDQTFGSYENAVGGLFDLELVFCYDDPNTDNTSTYTFKGYQYFVMAPFPQADDQVIWKLLGQKDTASFRPKSGDISWGSIKSLFL